MSNNMSILNENPDSYLLIGNITQPRGVIKNVRCALDEVVTVEHSNLQPGINFVTCRTTMPYGLISVDNNEIFCHTCFQIGKQTVFVQNNEVDIMIKNRSENNCEIFPDIPLAIASTILVNNISPCYAINETAIINNNDDNRFSFPLNEEEGNKFLISVGPFSLPLYEEGEEEEVIDWKKEISKIGVFPPQFLNDFIYFVETEVLNLFARTKYDCGMLDKKYGYIEDIPMTTDRPIASPQMNVGPVRSAQIRSAFNKLEANSIVIKGLSPYATPCFVVPKITTNRTRFVMDFRELNKNCKTL